VNGASYPQISTREAQSTLRIKSGETLVMGGLMKTEELRQMERVPILGQIPFLGELFTRRKATKSASQVLIAIRPTLLRHDESR
jgi:type IV pilus assembly protein PilQ